MTTAHIAKFSGGEIHITFIPPSNDKLRLVVETTSSYKKSGIYSAQRDDTSKPIVIDWGDGTVENISGDISQKVHEYTSIGTFNVTVENIKSYAPSSSSTFQLTSQNKYTLKEIVTMPSSMTSLDTYAFFKCSSLTGVTIGNSVTSIEYQSFYQCNELASVTIPNSVTSIGSYAFYQCYALTSITIPDSVTTINDSAFVECTNLSHVIIGSGISTIKSTVFANTSLLQDITFVGKTMAQVQSMSKYPWGANLLTTANDPRIGTTLLFICTDGNITITRIYSTDGGIK